MAKQKQKQTQIVNIHLGTKAKKKKGKGKPKSKKSDRESKTQIIPAFSPPPIINYPPMFVAPNQPNWFKPPPVSQSNKEYAVFPEAETAGAVGLNPTVPVPLRIQGAESLLKPPVAEPNLSEIAAQPTVDLPVGREGEEKAGEEVILPLEPPPEEDISVLGGGSLGETLNPPPSDYTPTTLNTREVQFRQSLNELGRGFAPPYIASQEGVPLSFVGSEAYPTVTGSFPVEASTEAQPKGQGRKEKAKKRSTSSAGSIHSFFPSAEPATLLPPITRTGAFNVTTGQRSEPSPSLPLNIDPYYEATLIPSAKGRTFTLGTPAPPSFIGQPIEPPTQQRQGGLERQRGVGITPAEQSFLEA